MKFGDMGRQFEKLAERMKTQMKTAANDHIRAQVCGIRCATHGTYADVALVGKSDDQMRFEIRGCCDELKAEVERQLEASGASRPTVSHPEAISSKDAVPKSSAPTIFLSHATLDKERFVSQLDQMLRDRGVVVWLDDRELLPGRNLVDEIFEHGIGKADIVIVVLSANSIDRPWVQAELTTAVVRQIEGRVKALIPIILDGVKPPVSVERLVQVRIDDLANLAPHVDRIVAAIFGTQPAPVAERPAYTSIPIHGLSGLTADDERVFVLACEQLLQPNNMHPAVLYATVQERAAEIGMSDELVLESFAILEQQQYFRDIIGGLNEGTIGARVSSWALERYLTTYQPETYRDARSRIVAAIVNDNVGSIEQLQMMGIHYFIAAHVINQLDLGGHLITAGGGALFRAKPSLARVLRNINEQR